MEEYKTIPGPRGTTRFMFKGKFVKKSNIPPDVLIKLQVGMSVDVTPVEKVPLTCIFCGLGTKITRFLNLQSIPICEEHYYSTNVGQVIQQLRKVQESETP